MKLKIINEQYLPATGSTEAWMVRKNGEAIPVVIHPYGKPNGDDDLDLLETLNSMLFSSLFLMLIILKTVMNQELSFY